MAVVSVSNVSAPDVKEHCLAAHFPRRFLQPSDEPMCSEWTMNTYYQIHVCPEMWAPIIRVNKSNSSLCRLPWPVHLEWLLTVGKGLEIYQHITNIHDYNCTGIPHYQSHSIMLLAKISNTSRELKISLLRQTLTRCFVMVDILP